MKRALFFALASILSVISFAQSLDDPKYGAGQVPVENGKVTFVRTIDFSAAGVSEEQAFINLSSWAKGHFVAPLVLSGKVTDRSGKIVISAEEYITFKKTAFVTDRSRMSYLITLSFNGTECTMTITDIAYWYEEERDGGSHFTAEDWITDSEAFGKSGKLLKTTGKFRIKTIDFVDGMVQEIKEAVAIK